ncbi:MAG: TRAP transporter large permease [Candidatus Rokuibacteriota bacterium]
MDWLIDNLALVMFGTMFVVIFCGYPVAFVLGGTGLLFAVVASLHDAFPLASLSNIVLRMWGGVAVDPVLVSVPMFIFMGTLLERSGVAGDMLEATQVLMRRTPGSLAVAVMVMGTILAAPIGVVGASVVLLSLIALPQMLARGYDRRLAIGTIGAAGTLGILIPPSIMLVVLGEMLSTSAGAVFMAAVMPGFLLSGLYLAYIVAVAIWQPHKAPALPDARTPLTRHDVWRHAWRGLAPMTFLMVVVMGSIFAGWATATESSAIGVLGSMLVAWFNGRLGRGMLKAAARDAARANGMVFMIFLGATGFSYVFRVLGGDELMTGALAALRIDTRWEILAFVMVLVFLLGFPFEWLEICLIVLPVFVPILVKLDFSDHLGDRGYFMPWFATLVSVNLQTAFMTPPFGGTLFYMKGTVPPDVPITDVYRGMTPFVLLQVVGLVLCIAFPEIALWLPRVAGLLD